MLETIETSSMLIGDVAITDIRHGVNTLAAVKSIYPSLHITSCDPNFLAFKTSNPSTPLQGTFLQNRNTVATITLRSTPHHT